MKIGNPCALIVVTTPAKKDSILESLHEGLGHCGETGNYQQIAQKFWWPYLKKCFSQWCKSCEVCQKTDLGCVAEIFYPTGESTVFGRISMDVVQIKAGGAKDLIVARDDFSGWVEAKFLKNISSKSVVAFLYKTWTMRYDLAKSYSTDCGSEFGGKPAKMI